MTSKLEKPKPHEMLPRQKVKRKSGGQPGNINALKHGFYSRRFSKLEIDDLKTILPNNFEDDIAVVRVSMRRLFDLAGKKAKTINEWATVNYALGSNAARIGSLRRVQYLISGDKSKTDELSELIINAFDSFAQKKGLY